MRPWRNGGAGTPPPSPAGALYKFPGEPNRRIKYSEMVMGKGARGQDFYEDPNGELLHLTNWVECVRSRQKPNCPAEAGVSAASAAHLANASLRRGEVAKWETRG